MCSDRKKVLCVQCLTLFSVENIVLLYSLHLLKSIPALCYLRGQLQEQLSIKENLEHDQHFANKMGNSWVLCFAVSFLVCFLSMCTQIFHCGCKGRWSAFVMVSDDIISCLDICSHMFLIIPGMNIIWN